MFKFGLCLLLLQPSLFAGDKLTEFQSTLMAMRGKWPNQDGPRGASPKLTVVKHQLRDWVESQLKSLAEHGDEGTLQRQLNTELLGAQLFCDDEKTAGVPPCPNQVYLGFLAPVRLYRSSRFLVLRTGVGIACGFDDSAYVYSWSGEGWHRIWQNEQNQYADKQYKPQAIEAVLITPYSQTNDYLVLTLGREPWCSSNWHPVYYRVYRLGGDLGAPPIIDGEEFAYMPGTIHGSVTQDEVWVQYHVGSIDGAVHSRITVHHYRIRSDGATRVAPFALKPRDFVDEWLSRPWQEVMLWTRPATKMTLGRWHKEERGFGEFVYPTKHCTKTPDLWQVGIDFSENPGMPGNQAKVTYYLVRWQPPYQFTMVAINDHPWPGCTEDDRQADDEDNSLFPGEEW